MMKSVHSISNNIKIIISDKADKVIGELLQSFLNRYHIGLKISIIGSNFIFSCSFIVF